MPQFSQTGEWYQQEADKLKELPVDTDIRLSSGYWDLVSNS